MRNVTILIDPRHWDYLEQVAVAMNRTRQQLVRDALYTVMEKHATGQMPKLSFAPWRPKHAVNVGLAKSEAWQAVGVPGNWRTVELDPYTGIALRVIKEPTATETFTMQRVPTPDLRENKDGDRDGGGDEWE